MAVEKKFEYNKFETLNGLELGLYFCSKENQVGLNEDFIEYVKKNSHLFDDEHLQLAIVLLGEIKTLDAYREVAKYIDHPETPVRFPAIKILTNNEDYDGIDECIIKDEFIMTKVKKTLEEHGDLFAVKELKHIIEKDSA